MTRSTDLWGSFRGLLHEGRAKPKLPAARESLELACGSTIIAAEQADVRREGEELQDDKLTHEEHPADAVQPGRMRRLQHAAVLWLASEQAKGVFQKLLLHSWWSPA